MTRDELLEKLRTVEQDTMYVWPVSGPWPASQTIDREAAHVRADELLLEYINDPEAQVFNDLEKWYA